MSRDDADRTMADEGHGDGSGGGDERDSDGGDQSAVARVELAVMVLSVCLTVALFGVLLGAALTAPQEATPTVTVAGVEAAEDGSLHATVRFRARGTTGVERSLVEVTCGGQSREVTFENVPADDDKRATVVCPAGSEPTVELRWWHHP